MAKTQDIKRRIRSVRNTMQLTRAMKMVSAAKLRRAQERIERARPYAHRLLDVLRSLSARADRTADPLLNVHGERRVELIVLTGDRGLCGSFNAGITRHADNFARGLPDRELSVAAVGKKSRDHFNRGSIDVRRAWVDVFRKVEFSTASEIAREAIERYHREQVDEIYLVYNEFKSAIQSKPVVQRLLPIEPQTFDSDHTPEDYVYEPNPEVLLSKLVPHYVEGLVFHAMLESSAAEHAARMTAMDAATNNAGELIETLTLTMNRVRQASITTEIIEVVSGAEALG